MEYVSSNRVGTLNVRKQANNQPRSDEILRDEFPGNEVNVGHVHLVDETVDALLQRFPGGSLVLR